MWRLAMPLQDRFHTTMHGGFHFFNYSSSPVPPVSSVPSDPSDPSDPSSDSPDPPVPSVSDPGTVFGFFLVSLTHSTKSQGLWAAEETMSSKETPSPKDRPCSIVASVGHDWQAQQREGGARFCVQDRMHAEQDAGRARKTDCTENQVAKVEASK